MNAPTNFDRRACSPQVGRRPVMQNCTIAELGIDPSYQRSIENGSSTSLIRRMARDWDWGLCQPLVVASRPNGDLRVVDGQHRLAAARLRGDIYDLPCVVRAYEKPADEARHFVALNQERRPLGAIDLFKAALAGNDPGAWTIVRLLNAAGLNLASHSNYTRWKPGEVSNIGGILRCHKVHGDQVTARALSALSRGFAGEVLRYGGTIFAGIVPLIVEGVGKVDDDLLALVLGGADQPAWMKEIAGIEAERSVHRSVAAAVAVREAYEEARAEELAVAAA